MASPQLENGHTQIANEILERLMRLHLPPNQWQVLLCIIRKTYGYHKTVDYIANSQIVEATGLCKAVVSRSLKNLEQMMVVTRKNKEIGLQKDWEHWKKLAIPSSKVSSIVNKEKLAELAVSSTPTPAVSSIANNEKLAISSSELAISSSELAISSTKVSSCAVAQKKKETITKDTIQKKGPQKEKYGELNNVLLTDEEHQSLKDKLGEQADEMIETLSEGIASHGYKYASHYATILSWKRRDDKAQKSGGQHGAHQQRTPRAQPEHYTRPEDL